MDEQPSSASPALPPARPRDLGRWWVAGWIAAIVLRALWLALVHEPSRAVYSDMGGYLHRARELFEQARWSPFVTFQGLGYPALLGLLRKLWASEGDLGVVTGWVQLGVSLAALAGMVLLARRIAGRAWAGLALALGAVHVPWLSFVSLYMPETVYTALLAALGLALLRLAGEPDARWPSVLLVGFVGAAAAWQKNVHLFVGPIAAIVWLYPLRRGWRGAARILAGWFAALALFFWIPHGTLSYARTGQFIASPPAGGMNFMMGKCPWKENGDRDGYRYWPPLFVQLGRQNTRIWPASFLDQPYFVARGLECIAEKPSVLLQSLEGIPYLFVGNRLWPTSYCGPRSAQLNDAWARIFSWPLALGVALALGIGIARGVRRRGAQADAPQRQLAEVWLALATPVLSLFAMVWVLYSELRYRVPFDVFILPLALWGWKESLAGIGARLRARRAARSRAAVEVPVAPEPALAAEDAGDHRPEGTRGRLENASA